MKTVFYIVLMALSLGFACPSQEICDNQLDDDGDGYVDCYDVDCAGVNECFENCTDNIDNDKDLFTDCEDSDCRENEVCYCWFLEHCGEERCKDPKLHVPKIIFDEVQPEPSRDDDQFSEFLDLKNTETYCVDATNLRVVDDDGNVSKFPDGFMIPARHVITWGKSQETPESLYCDYDNDVPFNEFFSLNNASSGDVLTLYLGDKFVNHFTYTGNECPPGTALVPCGGKILCETVSTYTGDQCADFATPGTTNTVCVP